MSFHRIAPRRNSRMAVLFASCLLAFALLAQAAGTLESVRASGVLRIGVDVPYGRMEYVQPDGSLAGVDIDVANEIAARLGVRTDFVTMPFDDLFAALDEERVDLVVSAVTITAERQKSMRFSVPYFDAALQVAVRTDSDIFELEDLKGRRVGVLSGTVGEGFAEKSDVIDNERIIRFDNNARRTEALVAGSIDAILMHFSLRGHDSLRTLPAPISQSYYGVVGRLKDEPLMTEVDATLRALKRDGRLEAIKRTHLQDQ